MKKSLIMGIILLFTASLCIGCAKQPVDSDKPVSGMLMDASELTEYLHTRNQEPSFYGGKELSEEEAKKGLEYYNAATIDKKDSGDSVSKIIAGIVLQRMGKAPVVLEYDGHSVWDASNFGKETSPRLKSEELEQWFAGIVSSYEQRQIKIEERLLNISGNDADEFIEDIAKVPECEVTEIQKETDGSVLITVTDKQRKQWEQYMKNMLKEHQEFFATNGVNYHIDVDEDCTNANFYYDLKLDKDLASMAVLTTEYYCALIQKFNGIEDWFVSLKIYNSETGKLVVEGDSENAFSYNESDWEISMQ